MLGKEEWVLIRGLGNKQGLLSISEIARQTGHDRKTVRKYLQVDKIPGYPINKESSKLNDYKDCITFRLKEVPEITVKRILREIKEKGYTGSYTILKAFVRPLREEKDKEAVIRFETTPGEQSQVDWSYFGTIEDYGIRRRLYCFSMVLGFSRILYIEFTTSLDIFTFLRCHQNAFLYFGGYTRTILYDNTKTVVLYRCEGNIQWNEKFMDFAGFWGFEPRLCRLYRAKTKGKVERPYYYIWQDFFIGRKLEGLDDLNQKALLWLNTLANTRIHGTTKEVPFERLKRENLLPLKERLYDTSYVGPRKASLDCFISYEGNRYSIPYKYASKTLTIRADKGKLKIYTSGQDEPVAVHLIFKGKGKDIVDPKHTEGIKIKQRERWEGFKSAFLSLSPQAKNYWDGFLSSEKMRGRWWELRKILYLCEKYTADEVDYALTRAYQYKAYGYKYIEKILMDRKSGGMNHISDILSELLVKWDIPKVEERPLKTYEEISNY